MDCSQPRGEIVNDEYETHNHSIGGRWDTQRRIKHGQSTSWLERSATREKILRGLDGYRVPAE
jgi:hypothetical protein